MEEKIYFKIAELLREQKQAAVATVVRATPGTPRKIGAKMLVLPDGSIIGTIGGGGFEKKVIEEGRKVCRTSEPMMINEDMNPETGGLGAVCGGQVALYLEPILKKSRLFIFGAGHVGKAIAELAQYLDFNINIIDERKEWANLKNYPMPCKLWTDSNIQAARNIPLDKDSFIVILTYSWQLDESILKELIKKDYTYLGVIGSRNKIKTLYDNLVSEGFKHEDFSRVYAPIGLPIGAYSPHEIAVSILGEIIAVQKEVRHKLPGWQNAINLR
ncbi:MAG: XdhC family protein [Vulcanimicrobiota bacterium]